jgi:hypothetical protein
LASAAIAAASLTACALHGLRISVAHLLRGTAVATISLSNGTGAALTTNFNPGGTATASGALTATDTSPSWTLSVKDAAASNPGHMAAGAVGCGGSAPSLTNALQVQVTSALPGAVSAGTISITGTDQTVASATNQLLATSVMTTNYTQVIPASQVMRTGCVYSLTATYTLQ